jgi:hypothetical protein
MRAEFNVTREEVLALLKTFEEAGKAFYYKEYIIIPKWLKHQKITERNDIFLGVLKIFKALPDEIKEFVRDRRHYDFDVTPYIGAGKPRVPKPQEAVVSLEPQDARAAVSQAPPVESAVQEESDSVSLESGGLTMSLKEERGAPPENGSQNEGAPPKNTVQKRHDSDSDLDSDLDSDIDLDNKLKHIFSESESAETTPPAVEIPLSSPKPEKQVKKPKKPPLREREPENDYERVGKVYIHNWDILYSQGKVKTENPIINWTQTMALLKKHFEKLKPDEIIQAVNKGLNDDFIMQGGYSLTVMLSANVLNRLINTSQKGMSGSLSPPSLREKKSLKGLLSSW